MADDLYHDMIFEAGEFPVLKKFDTVYNCRVYNCEVTIPPFTRVNGCLFYKCNVIVQPEGMLSDSILHGSQILGTDKWDDTTFFLSNMVHGLAGFEIPVGPSVTGNFIETISELLNRADFDAKWTQPRV